MKREKVITSLRLRRREPLELENSTKNTNENQVQQ